MAAFTARSFIKRAVALGAGGGTCMLLLQQHRKAEMREAAAPVVAPYVSRSRQEPVQPKPEREAAEATMGDGRALAATDAGSAAPEASMRRAEEQKPATTEQGEAAVLDYESMEIETSTTCPLCKFMRESPCGRHWVTWEKCVAYHKDRGEDFVGPCHHFTAHLGACMAREADSFPPPMRRALGLEVSEEEDELWERVEAKEEEAAAATGRKEDDAGVGAAPEEQ